MARNKIEDLRDHLFEIIEMVKEGDMELEKAKAIADIAQVIINSAKVEIDFIKATGRIDSASEIFKSVDQKKIA